MRRVAIFAHFDPRDEIKPYVRFYLRALRPHCERMIFVSTANLSADSLASIEGLCDEAILRDNVGFDFGMWQHAIARMRLDDVDELLLTNSSVFGPMRPLARVFSRMAAADCDFWSVTDSNDHHWHLQSYFLCFRRRALESEAFRLFWPSVLPYRDKWQTILSYELGLSQLLVESGLRGKALVSISSLFPRGPLRHLFPHKRRNPMCCYPIRVLRGGSPFVKVELFRDNPAAVRLGRVYREMQRLGYERSLVEFEPAETTARR